MTASFPDVRQALANRIATISGLTVYNTIPDSVTVPAAIIGPPAGQMPFLHYSDTFDGGVTYLLAIRVYVSRYDSPMAQDALDPFVAPTGSQSLDATIDADPSLGGVVEYANLVEVRNYGKYTIGDVDYVGAEWLVRVMAH